jgi:hypothetical protein
MANAMLEANSPVLSRLDGAIWAANRGASLTQQLLAWLDLPDSDLKLQESSRRTQEIEHVRHKGAATCLVERTVA